ncbi:UNVERIFIED_CONTAM: hypothetical protein Slati_3723400 [Sesamum latifolium]|uniref:Uncharacterized protein n=1 Tax=Sesamum latifolium TaxID=2727402 RepID=A0AAW2U3Y5_9LAMI
MSLVLMLKVCINRNAVSERWGAEVLGREVLKNEVVREGADMFSLLFVSYGVWEPL